MGDFRRARVFLSVIDEEDNEIRSTMINGPGIPFDVGADEALENLQRIIEGVDLEHFIEESRDQERRHQAMTKEHIALMDEYTEKYGNIHNLPPEIDAELCKKHDAISAKYAKSMNDDKP